VTIRGSDGPIHAIVSQSPYRARAAFPARHPTSWKTRRSIVEVTARLYAAESKIRLDQEVLLGIAGCAPSRRWDKNPKSSI